MITGRFKWVLTAGVLIVVLSIIAATVFIVNARKKPEVQPFPTIMTNKEMVKDCLERSRVLVKAAVTHLNEHKLEEATRDLDTAIDIFPLNTEAYQMLVKTHLIMKNEDLLYKTLEKAGRSYPGFDQILSVIQDADLDNIPLPAETADVYVAPFKDNKGSAVSFMFDDGEASVYSTIMPLFDKYNYNATASIIPSLVKDKPGDMYWGSWSEWKDAASRGFEIANHSMHHRDAKTYTLEDLKVEITDSQQLIEKNIGTKVSSYVFPMDSWTDDAIRVALRTHEVVRRPAFLRTYYARTVDIMYGGPRFSVETANRLLDMAIKRHLWLVAEGHGLVIEGYTKNYKPLTAEFLQKHLAYVNAHENDVWVDTFGHIFDYLLLRYHATLERKDVSPYQVEVVLHEGGGKKQLSSFLTVVIKVNDKAPAHVTAVKPDGSVLKAWGCKEGHICVNLDTVDNPIQIKWDSGK